MQGIILDCMKDNSMRRGLRLSKIGGGAFQNSTLPFSKFKDCGNRDVFVVHTRKISPRKLRREEFLHVLDCKVGMPSLVLHLCLPVFKESVHGDESSGIIDAFKLHNIRHQQTLSLVIHAMRSGFSNRSRSKQVAKSLL